MYAIIICTMHEDLQVYRDLRKHEDWKENFEPFKVAAKTKTIPEVIKFHFLYRSTTIINIKFGILLSNKLISRTICCSTIYFNLFPQLFIQIFHVKYLVEYFTISKVSCRRDLLFKFFLASKSSSTSDLKINSSRSLHFRITWTIMQDACARSDGGNR